MQRCQRRHESEENRHQAAESATRCRFITPARSRERAHTHTRSRSGLVEGSTAQAMPTGFDPSSHAHFTHAQVPLQRGPPQGQRR